MRADDDAGKAAATSRADLPGADYEGARNDYVEDIVFRVEGICSRRDAEAQSDNHDETLRVSPLHPLRGQPSAGGCAPPREADAHLWSADDPYLYTLVVTLVDAQGKKIERIAEPQGLRIVRLVDRHLEVNHLRTFLNGVAWNEIDPVLGRAITDPERRRQMLLMKKAGVNCIRTAHYPSPKFLNSPP